MPVEYLALLPEIILTATAIVILLVDLWLGREHKGALAFLAFLGVLGAIAGIIPIIGQSGQFWGGMIALDDFTNFFRAVFLTVAGLVTLSSTRYLATKNVPPGEYFALLLLATLGMLLMAGSRDLLLIYTGLELASISSYALAGLLRDDPKSNEGAIKYFLNGVLASAVLLFGLSLVYGLTGSTHLDAISLAIKANQVSLPVLLAATAFLIAGFGFKAAAAPFHFWAPDTYQGAPTPVTAFFSVGPKGAVFAAILRTFIIGLPAVEPHWAGTFAWISLASMLVGNLTALWQTDIKRMMAYSSIAQAGYILVGLAVGGPAMPAVMFYVLAYAITNLGVFAVIIALDSEGQGTQIKDYVGLSQRAPLLAYALAFFFVSLIGIPPTVGFFGKFLLFASAIENNLLWLALAMAVNSAVSVGYYYGVVRNMFLVPAPETASPVRAEPGLQLAVLLGLAGTLIIGLYAGPFIDWAYLGASFPR